MKDNILDSLEPKIESYKPFKFQIIEFVLIGFFCIVFFLKSRSIIPAGGSFFLFYCLAITLYSFVRIFFEFKNKLITKAGVVLKIVLAINAFVIFIGFLFEIMGWADANLMLTISLLSLAIPYGIYALTLKDMSMQLKRILFFNAFFVGVLTIGILFRLEDWVNGQSLVIIGFILTLPTLILLLTKLGKDASAKEKYHAINYIARSILILFWGLFFLI
jgi:hypothetical protein